jgi:hypothetical protein
MGRPSVIDAGFVVPDIDGERSPSPATDLLRWLGGFGFIGLGVGFVVWLTRVRPGAPGVPA